VVELTEEQEAVVEGVSRRLADGAVSVTIGGYAGCGKTVCAAQLPERLGLRLDQVAYAAPTGKASRVLANRLPDTAMVKTVHGLIYFADEQHCADCPADRGGDCHGYGSCGCVLKWHRRSELPPEIELVVVDEASMVTRRMRDDVLSFGVPTIFIGDHGQLPPVEDQFGLMVDPEFRLETIHRQAAGNPILAVATLARVTGRVPYGTYGEHVRKVPSFDRWPLDGLEEWPEDLLWICGRNSTRMSLNGLIRGTFGRSGPPQAGDRVVCLRNDWLRGVANGELGTVLKVHQTKRTMRMRVALDTGKTYDHRVRPEQFGSEQTLRQMDDEGLWTFGYCLTCHKCADEETKILTQRGWKTHNELIEGDKALTLNPHSQVSEWQPIQAVHRYAVNSQPMLSIEAESHSSLTTLNHRWAVRGYQGKTVWRTSGHLYNHPSGFRGIFKAATHIDFPKEPKYSDSFVALVAWFWTEGSFSSNRGQKIDAVRINQSLTVNADKVVAIREALHTEFGPPRKLGRWTSTDFGWNERTKTLTQSARNGSYIYPERTFDRVEFSLNNAAGRLLSTCAPRMRIAPEFLLALTRKQLELFIRVSIDGDGSITDGHASISQGSRERLEAFQFACVLAGYSTVIRPEGERWRFRLKKGQILRPRSEWWQKAMRIVPYTGVVWCPQTANGTWLAKRNETTYFTGNSQGSQARRVIVAEEVMNRAQHARWLYTATTRAEEELTIYG